MSEKNFYVLDLGDDIQVTFPKHEEDKDKYLLITCAKNENEYITEWIEHYKKLDFDKIIICDNNDDESLIDVISDYIDSGFVEVFNCRGLNSFQVQLYSMFCSEGNYKWCAYFDCDEFLELNLYDSIKEYLATKENDICVSFNWLMYGSGDNLFKTEGKIQDTFKYPISPISLYTENCFIKSIVRGGDFFKEDCWFNGSHIPEKTDKYEHNIGGYFLTNSQTHQVLPPRYKEGYLKHYYTKSFEEWVNKAKRGWPDGTENLLLYRYFVCQDWCNLPLKNMKNALFIDKQNVKYDSFLEEYDVFLLLNPNEYIYAYLIQLYELLSQSEDHTFIISGNHIDDTIYNMIFEYGLKTNNRIVWANSDEEVWKAYMKYNKGKSDTYYIFYLQ